MKAYVKSKRPRPKPEEFQATIENNKLISHVPRSRNWFSGSFLGIPSPQLEDDLIESMQEFVDKDGAFEVLQWLKQRMIPRSTWYEMCEVSPRLQKAYTEMKLYLGLNQRNGVRNRAIDGRFPVMSMHVYDDEWDKINRYHAQLRQQEAQQSGFTVVEIPVQRVTGRVPELKRSEVIEVRGERDGSEQIEALDSRRDSNQEEVQD
jgi:hypothetical protein